MPRSEHPVLGSGLEGREGQRFEAPELIEGALEAGTERFELGVGEVEAGEAGDVPEGREIGVHEREHSATRLALQ